MFIELSMSTGKVGFLQHEEARGISANSHLFFHSYESATVNWWFGAQWFGFLGSHYEGVCSLGVPLESKTTWLQTTQLPLVDIYPYHPCMVFLYAYISHKNPPNVDWTCFFCEGFSTNLHQIHFLSRREKKPFSRGNLVDSEVPVNKVCRKIWRSIYPPIANMDG